MTWVKGEFLSWCEAAILSLPPGAPLVSSEISSKCLDADGFCVSPLSRVDVERNVDVDGLVGGFGYVFILRRRRRKKRVLSVCLVSLPRSRGVRGFMCILRDWIHSDSLARGFVRRFERSSEFLKLVRVFGPNT